MYLSNGVEWDDCNGVIEHGSDWLSPISPVVDVVTVPGVHGITVPPLPPVVGQRTLTMKIGCAGSAGWAETRRVLRLLTMPRLVLTRRMPDQPMDRCTEVVLTSLSADDTTLYRYTRYTAVFSMTSPFWRAPDPTLAALPDDGVLLGAAAIPGPATRWEGEPNNSVSVLTPDGCPDGYQSDAPIDDMIIRVPKGGDAMTLTDPTSGTSVTWSGKTTSGYLYVDPQRLHAWTSGNATAWTGGADVTAGLDYGANGPLQIWPDAAGKYRVNLTVHGVPAVKQTYVRYYKSLW
mgnify:FL=1